MVTANRAERRRASRGSATQNTNGTGAAQSGQPPTHIQTVTMSSGVVFQLRKYNRQWLQEWMAKEPAPKPPVLFNEDNQTSEENVQDPDYLAARNAHVVKLWFRARDFMVMTGTEVHYLPPHVAGPESEDWLSLCQHMGVELPLTTDRPGRYLAWCRMMAILDDEDDLLLTRELTRLTGTAEEDVAQAVAAFPGDAERGADTGGGDAAHGGDGDRDGAVSAGGRAGARGAGDGDGGHVPVG